MLVYDVKLGVFFSVQLPIILNPTCTTSVVKSDRECYTIFVQWCMTPQFSGWDLVVRPEVLVHGEAGPRTQRRLSKSCDSSRSPRLAHQIFIVRGYMNSNFVFETCDLVHLILGVVGLDREGFLGHWVLVSVRSLRRLANGKFYRLLEQRIYWGLTSRTPWGFPSRLR